MDTQKQTQYTVVTKVVAEIACVNLLIFQNNCFYALSTSWIVAFIIMHCNISKT